MMVNHTTVKKRNAATLLANAVSAKIEDGNLQLPSGLCAQKTSRRRVPTMYTRSCLANILQLRQSAVQCQTRSQRTAAVQMTEAAIDVLRAVRSFPARSAGGHRRF